MKKKEKIGKLKKKLKKKTKIKAKASTKKKKKQKRGKESLWITVVIHSEMCVGEQ